MHFLGLVESLAANLVYRKKPVAFDSLRLFFQEKKGDESFSQKEFYFPVLCGLIK